MTIQDLGSLGEFVAALATIVTLIYLAIQIRQNTRSVRLAAESEASHQIAGWTAQVVNNQELGRIWDAAATDPDSLTDDEKRVYLWYVVELILLYESVFNLFREGLVSESSWMPKAKFILVLLRNSWLENWWTSRIAPLSEDYFNYIETMRSSAELDRQDQNVLQTLRAVPPGKPMGPDA